MQLHYGFNLSLVIGERDTIRGNSIENRGYLFIYMFGRTQGIFVL